MVGMIAHDNPLRLPKRHFYALDLSRLLAAVAVLFWHYLHFTIRPDSMAASTNFGDYEPLHWVFAVLYHHGHLAVLYFWTISGFVFAHVYLGDPAARERFWSARIARLWPLHLLTLAVVVVLQGAYTAQHGQAFVFGPNDLHHFLLNLAMIQSWGFQQGMSFNGPSWSISIEILAYAVFWALLPSLRERRGAWLLTLVLVALAAVLGVFQPGYKLWSCLAYFFAGTGAYFAMLRGWSKPWLPGVIGGCGVLLAITFDRVAMLDFPQGALWVLALFALALWVDRLDRNDRLNFGKRLGDISYGTYLWHFPIQLTMVMMLDALPGGRALSQHWEVLAIFVAAAIGAGFASHRWFERPAQRAVLAAAARFAPSRRAPAYTPAALSVESIQPPPSTRSPA